MRQNGVRSDVRFPTGASGMKKGGSVKKKIPAGKKGKGIRALKKKAPKVAKAMGYKKGGTA